MRVPALIELARRCEGSARDLLSVEAVGTDERTILLARKSSGDRLRREMVAESRLVLHIADKIRAVDFADIFFLSLLLFHDRMDSSPTINRFD